MQKTEDQIDATCETNGKTAVYGCTRCDKTEGGEVIEATGHKYESVVTDPTCETAGYTTYTCACGDTYTTDEVAALGHDMQKTANQIDATCEA